MIMYVVTSNSSLRAEIYFGICVIIVKFIIGVWNIYYFSIEVDIALYLLSLDSKDSR